MGGALALAARAAGRTGSNPNVGCLLVKDGRVVGRGWTADGGRPHAEAMALREAGARAAGATAYVTLEPCAHVSQRGPACADLLTDVGVAAVVVAMADPDPRTAGKGMERLRAAGIAVSEGVLGAEARSELAGFSGRIERARPELTLKLAMSLDGRMALRNGESQWITGPQARLAVHGMRARSDMVVVGRGTYEADAPGLDVRLPGWHGPQPLRAVVGHGDVRPPILRFATLEGMDAESARLGVNRIFCEGGGGLAAALLAADRVDRLAIFRAPLILGDGIGLEALPVGSLAETHGRWRLADRRQLGPDVLELHIRQR